MSFIGISIHRTNSWQVANKFQPNSILQMLFTHLLCVQSHVTFQSNYSSNQDKISGQGTIQHSSLKTEEQVSDVMKTDLMAKAIAQCLGLDIQTLADLGFCSPKCILKRELLESKNSALVFILVPMSRTRLSIEHHNGMVD